MNDELQNCASCAEAARERDEARAERDKENRVRTLAVDHYHLINEAMLQAEERVDRIAEAIGCPVHNQDGDDIDREVIVEAARTLVRERDEARAEVERLRHHASGMEDELRYGEEVCATIVDERDEVLSQVRTERDEARAEVERLRDALTAVVPQRRANQSCVEGREVVDADWLLENWSTLRDEEELLCTVGGVRRWLGVVLCDALTRPTDGAAAPE
jgi:hypothetical protein